MKLYAGIDLNSSNNYIGILNEKELFACPNLAFMVKNNIAALAFLGKIIKGIEKQVRPRVKLRKEFEMLLTITGVGDILGPTIILEVGDINRFDQVGDYSSYCRCVKSERISNGKNKGGITRKTATSIWPGHM
ncbi:transposase [Thermodesulfobacteriota bacterium]